MTSARILLILFLQFLLPSVIPFARAGETVPVNLFNIGDSIGEAEAADNIIGTHHHDKVWSTGFDRSDSIKSFNERFADLCPSRFQANDQQMDHYFNQAITGSDISDFAAQAAEVVTAAGKTSAGKAGMITLYLGNNDACGDTLSGMTTAEEFAYFYRAGLDILANAEETKSAVIHVSSIPALYWLWNALRNDEWCLIAWQFVPCGNLLADPVNDCGAGDSHLDPDRIHDDDGPACIRRKQFHAMIRDTYNPILQNVLQEYINSGRVPNAYYNDVFDIQYSKEHVNSGDCFHPSVQGQALLAQKQWERSPWSDSAPACTEPPPGTLTVPAPWLYLLLFD